jgi:hypothetical protein
VYVGPTKFISCLESLCLFIIYLFILFIVLDGGFYATNLLLE